MAYTCEPQVDNEGNVVGFDTRNHQEGFGKFSQQDYIQNELTGEVNHVFQNVELRDEDSSEGYTEDSYSDALHELHPNLSPALDWAETNLPAGFIEAYNQAMDGDDLTEKGRFIDLLLQHYEEATEEGYEEQEEAFEEEEEEVDEQEVEAFLEELVQQEPMGEEASSEWQSVVDEAQAVGDEAYAAVAAATAAYHNGDVTAQEAIDWAVQNIPQADLLRVIRQLTQ